MIAGLTETPFTFAAVVHGRDGIRFTAATPTRAALVAALGDYARRNARRQLWPLGAELVAKLLANGKTETAVEMYFGLVGSRWDEEWLVTTRMPATPDPSDGAWATVGAIVTAEAEGESTARERPLSLPVAVESRTMTQREEQPT